MNRLTFLRHAKSSWTDDDLADHDRPLNERGQRAAVAMATYLYQEGLVPDCVLCSTATRTRETLQLMLPQWLRFGAPAPNILLLRPLYMATPEALMMQAHQWSSHANHMIVISHNPGLETLVSQLAPQTANMSLTSSSSIFPTAAMASFSLGDTAKISSWHNWTTDDAELTHFRVPKDLV